MDPPVSDSTPSSSRTESPDPAGDGPVCPECGDSGNIAQDHADRYCEACGFILEEGSEQSFKNPRNREFANAFEHSGTTTPTAELGAGSRTRIGSDFLLYSSREHAQRVAKLREWDQRFRLRGSGEQTLDYAVREIQRLCTSLGLPRAVRQTAGVLFKKAQDANLHYGFSSEPVITAAVYHAATLEKQPRRLGEVVAVSRVTDQDVVLRAMRRLNQELNLQLAPVRPNDFLARMATDLDVPNTVRRDAHALLDKLEDHELSGHKATSITAAALYHASLSSDVKQLTQDEVASKTDLSIGTVSRIYGRLFKK